MPELDLEQILHDLPNPSFKRRLGEILAPQTITPYITVNRVDALIDFVKQVFGAEELLRTTGSAGGTHCEVRIGDSKLMIGGGRASGTAMPTMLHLFVPDVDAVHERAVAAGAKVLMPPRDQEYGERDSVVEDPAGNQWCLATARGPRYKPDQMRNVTVYLHPFGVHHLIDFIERAFGAETLERHPSPVGTVMHAKVRLGNSIIEMGEAHGQWQPMPTMIYFQVADADRAYDRAVAAGGKAIMAPANQPHGVRMAGVEDATGNQWYIAGPVKHSE